MQARSNYILKSISKNYISLTAREAYLSRVFIDWLDMIPRQKCFLCSQREIIYYLSLHRVIIEYIIYFTNAHKQYEYHTLYREQNKNVLSSL